MPTITSNDQLNRIDRTLETLTENWLSAACTEGKKEWLQKIDESLDERNSVTRSNGKKQKKV